MNIKNKIKNMDREIKLDIIEISRGYIGGILLAILMFTGVVSAMYAGECDEIDLSELDNTEDILYMVVGNSLDMEGFNVTLNTATNSATICTVINYAPDSFTLVFFNNQTHETIKEVETIVYRRGGGGTSYINKIVIQNQTVYVPEYIDREVEVEVEKIVDSIEFVETGYELWHVLLAMAIGGVFCWYVVSPKKESKEDEEQLEMKKYE